MGKASRTKRDGTRQQKIAAQRAAARRAEIRNRVLMVSGVTVVIIAVVLAFVVVKLNSKSGTTASGVSNGPTGAALSSVVTDTTSVPASTLDQVGAGSGVSALPVAIKGGSPLTSGGKPEVLYMGAEYCPYCAAERWAMVVALSRFGTFSGLSTVHSGNNSGEPYPNTPTWTFLHATYTSKYLTFSPVEMETNIPTSGGQGYTTLQTPTSAQQALLTKYDAPPYVPSADNGAIPFIDFGNKYMISGASYSPQVLQGKSWSEIATALKDPTSPIAKAVDGAANYLTATICKLTGNQPATACTPVVKQLETKL
jgi:thiol-disulfide isomerase/thioredoxin